MFQLCILPSFYYNSSPNPPASPVLKNHSTFQGNDYSTVTSARFSVCFNSTACLTTSGVHNSGIVELMKGVGEGWWGAWGGGHFKWPHHHVTSAKAWMVDAIGGSDCPLVPPVILGKVKYSMSSFKWTQFPLSKTLLLSGISILFFDKILTLYYLMFHSRVSLAWGIAYCGNCLQCFLRRMFIVIAQFHSEETWHHERWYVLLFVVKLPISLPSLQDLFKGMTRQ